MNSSKSSFDQAAALRSVVREDPIEYGFIVSSRDHTYYFVNNNALHFALNADELVKNRFVCWRNGTQLGSITT